MAKGFVYRGGTRTAESIKRQVKQATNSYDSFINPDVTMFKPKEGENIVRFLPPTWQDMDTWGDGWHILVHVHFGVGADEATYLCLDKMKGEACPVCEARAESTDEEEQKDLSAKKRVLCWVIDRDNEKVGPQLWAMAVSLFQDIAARSVDKKSGKPIQIDHHEEGYDLVFTRVGTKLNTKYTGVEVMRDNAPIHDNPKTQAQWLAYIEDRPLPEMLNYYEYDYIQKVLFGKADRRTVEATLEDVQNLAPKVSTRRAPEPPPVVEEEPPFDTGDEDAAPPPRSTRRALLDDDGVEDSSVAAARRALGRLKRA